jgi:hypothetical protein
MEETKSLCRSELIGQRPLEESGKMEVADMKSTIANLITLTMIFALACVIRLGFAFEMMR